MQHQGSRQRLTQSHDGRSRVPGQGVRDKGTAHKAGYADLQQLTKQSAQPLPPKDGLPSARRELSK